MSNRKEERISEHCCRVRVRESSLSMFGLKTFLFFTVGVQNIQGLKAVSEYVKSLREYNRTEQVQTDEGVEPVVFL